MKNYLQVAYFLVAKDFNEIIALEEIEYALRTDILPLVNQVLEIYENRFKVELLMFPSWATEAKSYRIGPDLYTHIRIKEDLFYFS